MNKDNPACYECPKGKNGLHYWFLLNNGLQAKCSKCDLVLNEQHTLEVYENHLPKRKE